MSRGPPEASTVPHYDAVSVKAYLIGSPIVLHDTSMALLFILVNTSRPSSSCRDIRDYRYLLARLLQYARSDRHFGWIDNHRTSITRRSRESVSVAVSGSKDVLKLSRGLSVRY